MSARSVPAMDEAATIAETVRGLFSIPEITQVLVIDDGSTDDTADRARGAGATVLRFPINQGQAQAIMAGARAIDDADIFLIVDGDVGRQRGRGAAAAPARPRGRGRHDDREPAARGDRRVRDGEEDRAVGGPPGDRPAAQGADLGPAGDARRPPPVDEAERALRVLGLAEHRRQPRRRPDPRGRRPADAPAHGQDAQRLRAPREAGLLPPASPLAAAHLDPLPDRRRVPDHGGAGRAPALQRGAAGEGGRRRPAPGSQGRDLRHAGAHVGRAPHEDAEPRGARRRRCGGRPDGQDRLDQPLDPRGLRLARHRQPREGEPPRRARASCRRRLRIRHRRQRAHPPHG